jgi:hypothetical protein
MGGLEKIDVAASIWQVFSQSPQHPPISHSLLDLAVNSTTTNLCASHTFHAFVLSNLPAASLVLVLGIRA